MVTLKREVSLVPQIVRAEEGVWGGAAPEHVRPILTSAQTGGAFMMSEVRVDAPNYGPPYHVHALEDETFIVLEGELLVIADGVRHTLRAGDTAFGPRNVPHTWKSGPNGVRMILIATGSNFERFYPRVLAAIEAGEMHRLESIAAEHGITLLPEN